MGVAGMTSIGITVTARAAVTISAEGYGCRSHWATRTGQDAGISTITVAGCHIRGSTAMGPVAAIISMEAFGGITRGRTCISMVAGIIGTGMSGSTFH